MLRRLEFAGSALGPRVPFGAISTVLPAATSAALAQAETQAPIIGAIQGVTLNDATNPFSTGASGLSGNGLLRDQASFHFDGGTWGRPRAIPKGTTPHNNQPAELNAQVARHSFH